MAATCTQCGALIEAGKCKACGAPETLGSHGLSIRPAERGGGLILVKLPEAPEDPVKPLEMVKDTQKWMDETVHKYKIDGELLRAALLEVKLTPKKKANDEED